jgi:hypothetical protein
VEEAGQGVPDLPRCGAWSHDDAEELGGDRAVDPREDGVIVPRPVRGGRRVRCVASVVPVTWLVRP